MAAKVKTSRTYDSSLRTRQAADRRLALAVAARDLFVEHGYPATTMDAVAARAEVSLKTVYNAYATKAGLLGPSGTCPSRATSTTPALPSDRGTRRCCPSRILSSSLR